MAAKKKDKRRLPTKDESKPPEPAEPDTGPEMDFASNGSVPVVGIGASAGGLDAFKKLFAAMPNNSGVAFVLIPHLDPKHESLMVELLARQTKMPVVEAEEGMAVEANRLHIIPPNKYMTISGGVLRLTGPVERTHWQTSIDLFLRSLADDQMERAICIVLSGTGAHGTLGLKAVKAAGGMAMVQDPTTAEYPRMPQNAIATGLADYILPVEQMPEALVKYVQHFYLNGGALDTPEHEVPDHLNQVLALLRTRNKFDFRAYRKKMLRRRIDRRMGLNHFEKIEDYITHLRATPDEVHKLGRDLLISVTSFFRDPEGLATLQKEVIGPAIERKQPDESFRVWIPGCATGEEAYSIAMLVLEECAKHSKACRLQIFATDVDEDALQVAREGVYPDSIAADVSPERLKRFFTRADDASYRVNKQVRESIVFAAQNLITDAPFSKVDLVSCRNILIYLEPDIQKKVVMLLHFALVEGGHLLLGPSETIGRHTDLFNVVSKKWRIFRRIGPTRTERVEFPIIGSPESRPLARGLGHHAPTPRLNFADLTQRLLVEEVAPAGVLINRKYEVLYFLGPVTRYLDVPPGEPTQDILAMAREGLRTKLRGAIHKAIEEGNVVKVPDQQIRRNDSYQRVAITIRPILAPKDAEGLLLVIFQDVAETAPGTPSGERAPDGGVVKQLEYELRATKEDLQSTIEEMESANEELKASNEEVMSMNEELQSANEELETSKEELQSLNEELSTVNNQLQEKVDQLEQANNDMANLLNCTDIATLFLDNDLKIRRFTPATGRMVNVVHTDIGRPITEIKLKFEDPDLVADARQVLTRLAPREKEVIVDDGRWCIRRIIPYRTVDDRIQGVVVTFADVTELKLAGIKAGLLATIMRNSFDAVIVHDIDGKITSWNRGAERLYGYKEADALTMSIRKLIPDDSWKEYRQVLEQVSRAERVESFEAPRLRKDGTTVDVWITATGLTDEHGKVTSIAKIDRDITERKQYQSRLEAEVERRTAALHENEARMRAILQSPDDAIITIDHNGLIDSVNKAAERMFGYAAAEMLGKNVSMLGAADHEFLAMRDPHAAQEVEARRKNGSTFWVDLSVSSVEGRQLFTAILRDISRRKQLEREVVEIAALEQQRIGQDLHDECGQSLTAVGLMLDTLKDRSPAEVELVRKISAGVTSVLRRVRDIARGLTQSQLKANELPGALRKLAAHLRESSGVSCSFDMKMQPPDVDDVQASHLYHIAQEACTNALKHARAKNVVIRLFGEDHSLTLQVVDDGDGYDGDATHTGVGLRIMRNRASVIKARFSIERTKPKGTAVTCVLNKEISRGGGRVVGHDSA
jgi:two-component system CheB/CheR fusion protein